MLSKFGIFTLIQGVQHNTHKHRPGRHGVVEDGVDGGVDVEHQAGEVQQVEVNFAVCIRKTSIKTFL